MPLEQVLIFRSNQEIAKMRVFQKYENLPRRYSALARLLSALKQCLASMPSWSRGMALNLIFRNILCEEVYYVSQVGWLMGCIDCFLKEEMSN